MVAEEEEEKGKVTFILVLSVFICVFSGSFQYGYNIAVMNAPAPLMKEFFFGGGESQTNLNETTTSNVTINNATTNETVTTNKPSNSDDQCNPSGNATSSDTETVQLSSSEMFLWSFTIAIYTVGGMVGSYITGIMVKKFGRKGAMLWSNSLSIVASIMVGSCKAANSIEMVIIARFLLGIFAGLATGVVPLYIGEISPKHLRGAIGVVNQLFMTVGILVAQLLSLNEALGTEELWPLLLAMTVIPSIVQLCVMPFLPESPRCLLIDKEDEEAARKALIRFRGSAHSVDKELNEMKREAQSEAATEQLSALDVIRDKTVRWQLISIVVLQMTQQACGINAIFFYLNTIFETAGVPEDTRNYAAVGVGTVNVFMTVVSALLMDRAGRKALLGGGYGIAAFFSTLLTISLTLQCTLPWMSNMSIAAVIGFIIGFAIGPGPVPWILTAEYFRQSARPAASAIGCGVNWTFNFLVALIFPFMREGMGPYVFVIFLAVSAFACGYVIVILPETKNKTFQEINLMFAKRNKIRIDQDEMEELGHIVINRD